MSPIVANCMYTSNTKQQNHAPIANYITEHTYIILPLVQSNFMNETLKFEMTFIIALLNLQLTNMAS